jgi:hypothetical protein
MCTVITLMYYYSDFVEPVTISLHALLSSLIFTCKNYLDCDIFRYFYFFTNTKYIALLSFNNLLITKITLNGSEITFLLIYFLYEMIKYQLNITLYEKISLYSIRFDISLSQACCPGITEMPFNVTEIPNGKMQCPGIRCVILLQTFSENVV